LIKIRKEFIHEKNTKSKVLVIYYVSSFMEEIDKLLTELRDEMMKYVSY